MSKLGPLIHPDAGKKAAILKFKKISPVAQLPSYATPEAAGMDVRAIDQISLGPGSWAKVSIGLAVEIPPGWELQVRGRSGLAVKHGVTVLNAPGTIDSDYRGEIGICLVNNGKQTFHVEIGDRIAQLVLARAPQAEIKEVDELSTTDRGTAGFGSTGVS